ncbi:MAG: hypothetical protein HOW97_12250 [Catenulispora sp.]|nr:hypothetical protein [Catenulispora sp.]
MSAATRKKISKALKGKHHHHKGHKVSAATRRKLSKALKGKHHRHRKHPTGLGHEKARRSTGRHLSAKTRKRISAALKGKHHKRRKRGDPAMRAVKARQVRQKKPTTPKAKTSARRGGRRFRSTVMRHHIRSTRVMHGHHLHSTKRFHGIRRRSTRAPHYGRRVSFTPRKLARGGRVTRRVDRAASRHNRRRRRRR